MDKDPETLKDFKVLPWLRELRDRNAEELKGLSNEEIVARTRAATKDVLEKMKAQGAVVHDAGDWRRRGVLKNQEGQ
jgi:hypothetical protein